MVLLQTMPEGLQVRELQRKLLTEIPEIDSIHELHIWRLNGEKIIASVHLRRLSLSNYMLVSKKVKLFFHSRGIHSITVQFECDDSQKDDDNDENEAVSACLLRCKDEDCEKRTCCTLEVINSNALVAITSERLKLEEEEVVESLSPRDDSRRNGYILPPVSVV